MSADITEGRWWQLFRCETSPGQTFVCAFDPDAAFVVEVPEQDDHGDVITATGVERRVSAARSRSRAPR